MTKRRIKSRPYRGERLESRRCLAAVAFEPHIIDGTEFDQPDSIAAGDFDSDGDLDLFISARNRDGWYENTGNGDYGNYHRITHDEGARYRGGQVVVEDLDDDGDADVLVKRAYYSTYWLENNGSGQFGEPIVLASLSHDDRLTIADVNQDRLPDLVTATQTCHAAECTHVVGWHMNLGEGSWESTRRVITVQRNVDSVNVVDINDDQLLDVVLGSTYCSTITNSCYYRTTWFPNRANGEFDAQPTPISRILTTERHQGGVTFWEDIDGDGDNDGVIGTIGGGPLRWVEHLDGKGEFSEPRYAAALSPHVTIGDADADDDLDLLFIRDDGQIDFAQFNQTTTSFDIRRVPGRTFASPTGVILDDLNGDGINDIAAVSQQRNQLGWFAAQANDLRSYAQEDAVGNTLDLIVQSIVIDFDSDGDQDVLVSTADSNARLLWYENTNSEGRFRRRFVRQIGEPRFGAADIDGDGHVDLLVGENRATLWLRNDGQQNFGVGKAIPVGRPTSEAIDVDGDGDLDLLDVGFSSISWYENTNGEGDFTTHEIEDGLRRARKDFVGDFDEDGDVDVVYHVSCTGVCDTVFYYLENENGTFAKRELLTVRRESIVTSAFGNWDGNPGIDVAVKGTRVLSVFKNNGNGDLQSAQTFGGNTGRANLFFEDVDGDGDLDLAAIDRYSNRSEWFENIDAQRFVNSEPLYQFESFRPSTLFADFDGDELVDVLSVIATPPGIRWLENKSDGDDRLIGDANADGVFNSADLVRVFQAGHYELPIGDPVSFDDGDWNGDGLFNSGDLVAAFQAGHYANASIARLP